MTWFAEHRDDVSVVADDGRHHLAHHAGVPRVLASTIKVVHLLAYTDIPDRQPQFAGNRDHHSALGRAVQLRENNAGDLGRFCELASLLQSILPGGRLDYQ